MCFADRCDHAIPLFLRAKILPIHFLYYKLLAETMYDVNNDVIPSQLKDLFIPIAKIHSYTTRSSVPTTSVLKNQNLKLNENRFQELVQNCGMKYQLSSEHYQKPIFKRKIRMILFNILESEDSYDELESIISKVRKYS